ncbi:MAG: ATPase domain-containing protein [Candidatus Micrarchaeia archaeon]
MNVVERVKTGIPGLDKLIEGGIPRGALVLLSGQAGAGKTIFGLQYIVKGAMEYGEKGMYVSFEQKREDIIMQANRFGWNLEDLEKNGQIKLECLELTDASIANIIEGVYNTVVDFKPARLVIDSLAIVGIYAGIFGGVEITEMLDIKTSDRIGISGEAITRKAMMWVFGKFKKTGVTGIFISELAEETVWLSRDTISEFLADGVVVLRYTTIGGESFGTLEIRKMRSTNHKHGLYPTLITNEGFMVGEESTVVLK